MNPIRFLVDCLRIAAMALLVAVACILAFFPALVITFYELGVESIEKKNWFRIEK